MKRIITDERQQDLFYESPEVVIQRLERLRTKVLHNNPLNPTERAELGRILKDHPNANGMLRRLQEQNAGPRSWALRLNERQEVEQAINMTIATVREELARVLKK